MRLFGKAREAPPVSENLQKMRVCMTNLEKREEYLQQKYDQETVAARKYARTNKRSPLLSFCFVFLSLVLNNPLNQGQCMLSKREEHMLNRSIGLVMPD